MRSQTKSVSKKSCVANVRTVVNILDSLHGENYVNRLTHDHFYGLMLQYSPVKPHEFNSRTIERALRKVCAERRVK